jgi:phage gp29-like protein
VCSSDLASGGGALAAASKERQAVRLDLVQADSDLLSETLNSTLIAWLCEYNGLAPCLVYREISEEEDKKAESETDKNVAAMGFELSEEAVRAKYGDGWSKKIAPASGEPARDPLANSPETDGSPMPEDSPELANDTVDSGMSPKSGQPASFAEGAGDPATGETTGDAIDALIAAEADQWQPLLDPMISPLQAAFEEAARNGESAAELIARLPALLAAMDSDALAEALAKMCFTGRLAGNAGVSADA